MHEYETILAPCRLLNSTVFGGDGGCWCVMGGGYTNAAELGRERKSCLYSCSGCCQYEIGNMKQRGQHERTTFSRVRANSPARRRNAERKRGVSESKLSELQSKWIDFCLSGVNNLGNFNCLIKDAIVNPPVFVSAENLAKIGASHFRVGFLSKQGVFKKLFGSFKNVSVKCICIIGIKVTGNIIAGLLKCFYGMVGPLERHIAILSRGFSPLPALRRLARLPIMRLTCSWDLTSPRWDWPSLMRNPSYVSASCSFWQMISQSAALRKTDVARPFCVSMMGRCVSAVRATQSASVVRNSLMEIMSSVGLKSNMAFSPLVSMADIVRNYVRRVKTVKIVKRSCFQSEMRNAA